MPSIFVTRVSLAWAPNPVPNQLRRTLIAFVVPIPIETILTISSSSSVPSFTKSPAKNEVIPVKNRISLPGVAEVDNPVVTEVATIGDWIILSIATITFEFASFAVRVWSLPAATPVNATETGFLLRAFAALVASFTLSSLTLIQNTFLGRVVVVPTPTKPSVDAIEIKSVLIPKVLSYISSCPLTKKWLGKNNVLSVKLTTLLSDALNSLVKIVSFLWVNGKSLLTVISVPV